MDLSEALQILITALKGSYEKNAVYYFSFHILGNAGECLGSEFYAVPNLAQSMVQTVLSHLEVLPDYRLRPIIRILCLVLWCLC